MKKSLITIFLFCGFILHTFAQQNKFRMGLNVGMAFPIGDFASSFPGNDNARYAKAGSVLDLTFGYRLGFSNFGITTIWHRQRNPLDVDAMPQAFNSHMNSYIITSVRAEKYILGGIMLGPNYSFPLSKKIQCETRAMLGYFRAKLPEINASGGGMGKYVWIKILPATTKTIAYQIGASLKFETGTRTNLFINLDYLGSNPEFSAVEESNGKETTVTWRVKMESINLSLGFAIGI